MSTVDGVAKSASFSSTSKTDPIKCASWTPVAWKTKPLFQDVENAEEKIQVWKQQCNGFAMKEQEFHLCPHTKKLIKKLPASSYKIFVI